MNLVDCNPRYAIVSPNSFLGGESLMTPDQDRKSWISDQLPGIFQGLAAVVVGAVLAPAVSIIWQHYRHSQAPDWATGAIPSAVGAIGLAAIYAGIVTLRRFRTRAERATPEARGNRISIYVAKFGDDEESQTARTTVMESIKKQLGQNVVEVLPAGIRLRPTSGVSEDEAAAKPAQEARTLLRKKLGDLLIWGMLHKADGKSLIELHFVPASGGSDGAERKIFGFGEKLTLDADFGPEMGASLAAIAAVSANPVIDNSGQYLAQVLAPVAARLAPMIHSLPTSMRSSDRARLFVSYGIIQLTIGEQTGTSDPLHEAVVALREALKEHAREGAPMQWAMTQNSLGIALATLGGRESGIERLEEAVAAYREALKEHTRERAPLSWAAIQTNLGAVLRTLGERESGTERLEQAVAAYREALKESTRERGPLDWAATQNNLGNALAMIGERESGTDRLEEAVAAYREALKERTRERVPLDWAMTQNNLGNALGTLGERVNGTAREEEAVAAYREALKERTCERVPLKWAMTLHNLGIALQTLGERESGRQRLEEAEAALAAAWEVFQRAGMHHYDPHFEEHLKQIRELIDQRRKQ
jgi:tetratricopeptide (TPR) repeat protein